MRKQFARCNYEGAVRFADSQYRDAAGSSFASAAVVRQAPACVVAAADTKFLLSKNVRSQGAARSSGAIFTMRRAFGGFDANVAPVKAAISSRVRPGECRKKSGSLILLKPDLSYRQRPPRSEPSAAAETENLCAVTYLHCATRWHLHSISSTDKPDRNVAARAANPKAGRHRPMSE